MITLEASRLVRYVTTTTRRTHYFWLSTIIVIQVLMNVPRAACADFPYQISDKDVEITARATNCNFTLLVSPFRGLILTPKDQRSNSDPKYHQVYHTACHVYVSNTGLSDTTTPGYSERFIVYAPDASVTSLMAKTASLLVELWGEAHNRLHLDHKADEPTVQVWLTAQKAPGLSPDIAGEQFKNQIYLYDVNTERRPIEWLREIAHEYGHYSIPGISGFHEPEEWGNGVLGERLYLRWLNSDVRDCKFGALGLPFATQEALQEYVTKQVDPLIKLTESVPITAAKLSGKEVGSMDLYTALALYIASAYGDAQLVAAMSYTMPGNPDHFAEAPDFLRGFIESIKAAEELTVELTHTDGTDLTAKRTLYLSAGVYSVRSEEPLVQLRAYRELIPVKQLDTRRLAIPSNGWYHIGVTYTHHVPEHAIVRLRLNSVKS